MTTADTPQQRNPARTLSVLVVTVLVALVSAQVAHAEEPLPGPGTPAATDLLGSLASGDPAQAAAALTEGLPAPPVLGHPGLPPHVLPQSPQVVVPLPPPRATTPAPPAQPRPDTPAPPAEPPSPVQPVAPVEPPQPPLATPPVPAPEAPPVPVVEAPAPEPSAAPPAAAPADPAPAVPRGGPTTTVPGEPPGAIEFAPPAPAAEQPAGTDSITLVVPPAPEPETPAAPPGEVVGDPPPALVLAPPPATTEAVRPAVRPETPPTVAAAPGATPALRAAPLFLQPQPATAPGRDDPAQVVRTFAPKSAPERSADPAEPGFQPVPSPDRRENAPGQPFTLSAAFSASAASSGLATLAIVILLLFLAAPQLSRRLCLRAAAWRERAFPAPLPRPG